MRKLLILLLGAILIGILSYFCFLDKAGGIKEDLVSKAQGVYADKQMDWVHTDIKGDELEMTRILALSGTAPSEALKADAGRIALLQEGVSGVENNIIVATDPVAVKEVTMVRAPSPYTMSTTKSEDNKIVLTGYVNSEKEHDDIVSQAQTAFGSENVTDALKEFEGAPSEWQSSVKIGLDKLTEVDYGELKISDQDFYFKGYVDDAGKKEPLLQAFETGLDDGYLGHYDIESPAVVAKEIPSPYKLHVTKSKDEKIVLNGYVPNVKVHNDLVEQAKTTFGADNVTDALKEFEGAPAQWQSTAKTALDKLTEVDYGEYTISDKDFSFKGYVNDIGKKEPLIETLKKGLYSEYQGHYDIASPKKVAFSCQDGFSKILSGNKIHFQYNKADVKSISYPILDSLVEVANKCPEEIVSIEGHTDSIGSKIYNQTLSANRANAVKDYLIGKGLSEKRLEAIGFGESKPIADNMVKEGRAKNRRIEFNIKGVK